MVVGGGVGSLAGLSEAIAEVLVTWGVGQMGLVVTAYIGGASGERWAAWTAAARGGERPFRRSGGSGGYGEHPDGGGKPWQP